MKKYYVIEGKSCNSTILHYAETDQDMAMLDDIVRHIDTGDYKMFCEGPDDITIKQISRDEAVRRAMHEAKLPLDYKHLLASHTSIIYPVGDCYVPWLHGYKYIHPKAEHYDYKRRIAYRRV